MIWSTKRSSPRKPACPIRNTCSRATTWRLQRSICCAPLPGAVSALCSGCRPGIRNSSPNHRWAGPTNAWPNRSSQAIKFMETIGISADTPQINQTELFTSHEALLLEYEEALTRVDSITGDWYDCSAHMLWIGETNQTGRWCPCRIPARCPQPDRGKNRPKLRPRRCQTADPGAQP